MVWHETIISKLTSGRFIMTVAFTLTACYLAIKGLFPMEAFTGIITLVVREYFVRSDRASEQVSEQKEK